MPIAPKTVAIALVAAVVAVLIALALALESAPRVVVRGGVAPADVDRAVELAKAHDPRQAAAGRLQVASLLERDVDLLTRYAAQRWLAAPARAELLPGRLRLLVGLPAPAGR